MVPGLPPPSPLPSPPPPPPTPSPSDMSKSPTSTMDAIISILLSLFHIIVDFIKSLTAKADDMPRLYYPTEPAYFQAKKRNLEDVVTFGLTDEVRERHALGAKAHTPQSEKPTIVNGTEKERPKETVSIRTFVEARCPTLLKDYKPTWWLPTGHLNTIYCVIGDFTKKDLVDYERTLLRVPDGGTIGLDFTPPASERTLDPKTPIIVVLHGLSGGSFESYVRDVLSTACAPKEDGGLGYRAVVMNFRGCAGVPLTTAQLYSGAHTDDLRSTLLYIRNLYPDAPLLGIGFSLGANVLTRYVEEEGDNCRFRSACVLGCPWDLVLNSSRLENRWLYRNIYSKAMGGNLLYLLRGHLQTLAKLPPTKATPHIARLLQMRAPTLKDFDHHVTRFMGGSAPRFPLTGADQYYEISSGHHLVGLIKIPFIAFNAADDPIVAETPIHEIEKSKWCAQVVTPRGGHLGWFEGGWFGGLTAFGGPPPRWVRKPILEWLQATGEDLGTEFDFKGLSAVVAKNGFVLEDGKADVGFKVLGKGVKVDPPQGLEAQLAAAGS